MFRCPHTEAINAFNGNRGKSGRTGPLYGCKHGGSRNGAASLSISTLASSIGTQALGTGQLDSLSSSPPAATSTGPSFGDSLLSAFDNVNALQNDSTTAATQFALGKSSDIHSVMIAGQKAGIALELTTEVRNKIVDAYQQIMQMSM